MMMMLEICLSWTVFFTFISLYCNICSLIFDQVPDMQCIRYRFDEGMGFLNIHIPSKNLQSL